MASPLRIDLSVPLADNLEARLTAEAELSLMREAYIRLKEDVQEALLGARLDVHFSPLALVKQITALRLAWEQRP